MQVHILRVKDSQKNTIECLNKIKELINNNDKEYEEILLLDELMEKKKNLLYRAVIEYEDYTAISEEFEEESLKEMERLKQLRNNNLRD